MRREGLKRDVLLVVLTGEEAGGSSEGLKAIGVPLAGCCINGLRELPGQRDGGGLGPGRVGGIEAEGSKGDEVGEGGVNWGVLVKGLDSIRLVEDNERDGGIRVGGDGLDGADTSCEDSV
jgi:hypothetical protein